MFHARNFSAPLNAVQASYSSMALVAPGRALTCNSAMKTCDEIRRVRLAQIIEQAGASTAVANALGVSPAMVSQWKRGSLDSKTKKQRTISNETARKIEIAFSKPVGWMDNLYAVEYENLLSAIERRGLSTDQVIRLIEAMPDLAQAKPGITSGISRISADGDKKEPSEREGKRRKA